MNEKFQLSHLLADFAKHSNLSPTAQRAFVQQFFALIAQTLVDEGIVKVKGLGTFKLMEVAGRRSVDVNTGNPIEIERHTKISFTPDTEMKIKVNKPFEQFQTVVINDGTDLNLMENIPEATEPETEVQPVKPQEVPEEPQPTIVEPPVQPEPVHVEPERQDVQPMTPPTPEPQSELVVDETVESAAENEESEPEAASSGRWWRVALCVIGVLVLMGLSYWVGYNRLLVSTTTPVTPKPAIIAKQRLQTPARKPAVQPEIAPKSQQPTTPQQEKPRQKTAINETAAAQYPPHEGDKYRIVGKKSEIVLEKGETLNRISLKTYGSKQYVKYIVRFNHFENPDNLPVGTKVNLPELEHIP